MPGFSEVRIIGGKWRSRKIKFPETLGLRPTQDRIRETLFNWLMPYLAGSHCLDLFAGSGALGFEALSRGADFCCFVDQNSRVIQALHSSARSLEIEPQNYAILYSRAPQQLSLLTGGPFDIIFLDPPFGLGLLEKTIHGLAQSSLLKSQAFLYVEMEKNLQLTLPENWSFYRQQSTATLTYALINNFS